ncbi:cilia- and flagella- associated protein 210 [Onthophagus taurus]|uniref:cilia- and flagella- associated protein 210 n=1 Tax=Onthophagus taurus TaxID=166361 RepID=UPI0039BDE78D
MESRWYLLPGQTIENTKISERGHALHVSNTAWKKITGHLDRKKNIEDAIEAERAHRQALKEGSDAMTKNWPDSIEHVHMHKEMERKKQAEELDRQRMENFYVLRQEQADIKEAFMEKVKRTMFYSKSYPKSINGALMFSETLYERGKQIEFKKIINQHYVDEEKKEAEKIRQAAIEEKQENEEKEAAIRKKNEGFCKTYLKQIQDKEECRKKLREERIKEELLDNEHAKKEMELEKQIQFEEKVKEKAERKKEVQEFLSEAGEFKRLIKKEDDEVEEVIEVFEKAKKQIECKRAQRVLEMREQEQIRREMASRAAVAGEKAKNEAFERSIQRAKEEADAREAAAEQGRIEKAQRLRKERDEDRQNYLLKKAEQDRLIAEGKKWEMMNRLKQNECNKVHDQIRAQENWDKKLQFRHEILKQIAEDKIRGESHQKEINEYVKMKLKLADDEFFAYANHVIEEAKSNGRNTYPIEKIVDEYIKENMIDPGKKHEKICQKEDGTSMLGNVKMVNITPGKMAHDPRADPNYRRCPCHKEELYK